MYTFLFWMVHCGICGIAQLIMTRYWSRQWNDTGQAAWHYLSHWWPSSLTYIHVCFTRPQFFEGQMVKLKACLILIHTKQKHEISKLFWIEFKKFEELLCRLHTTLDSHDMEFTKNNGAPSSFTRISDSLDEVYIKISTFLLICGCARYNIMREMQRHLCLLLLLRFNRN